VFAFWRYWNTCFTLRRDLIDSLIDWLQATVGPVFRRLNPWAGKPA